MGPPLRALPVFEAAARHMSFQLAARELNLTPSAVSHHVKALETHLGQALFLRLNRGLRLTAAGESYCSFIRHALEKIDDAGLLIRERKPAERLRIRSGPSFAEKWLLPRLPVFLVENPHIEILIDTRSPAGDFRSREIDVEIHYGRVERASGLIVEPLCEETILPLCSPVLLRGPIALRNIEDLARHTLIESERAAITWSTWLHQHHGTAFNAPRLRFDRSTLALQAAVYGLGIALEGDLLASEELAAGRLITPFSLRDTAVREPLRYLVIPRPSAKLPNVRTFRDWLLREMHRSTTTSA
jgi:LysR family transcriptional regulator, glycine cleavage system transcriptional activator